MRRILAANETVRRSSALPVQHGRRTIAPGAPPLALGSAPPGPNGLHPDSHVPIDLPADSLGPAVPMAAAPLRRSHGRSLALTAPHSNPTRHRHSSPRQPEKTASHRGQGSRSKPSSQSGNRHSRPVRRGPQPAPPRPAVLRGKGMKISAVRASSGPRRPAPVRIGPARTAFVLIAPPATDHAARVPAAVQIAWAPGSSDLAAHPAHPAIAQGHSPLAAANRVPAAPGQATSAPRPQRLANPPGNQKLAVRAGLPPQAVQSRLSAPNRAASQNPVPALKANLAARDLRDPDLAARDLPDPDPEAPDQEDPDPEAQGLPNPPESVLAERRKLSLELERGRSIAAACCLLPTLSSPSRCDKRSTASALPVSADVVYQIA
jgi:hypothetical protein